MKKEEKLFSEFIDASTKQVMKPAQVYVYFGQIQLPKQVDIDYLNEFNNIQSLIAPVLTEEEKVPTRSLHVLFPLDSH